MSLSQFISLKTKVGNSYILRYIICSKSRLNGDTERCSFLKRVSKVRKKTHNSKISGVVLPPYSLPYNSYDVGLENLISDQLIIP